jgi:phosphoribosylformylglycinamidine synthase
MHLGDLVQEPAQLHENQVLMFVGGFSYGDHMGSGHVFGLRVRHRLGDDLARFVADGKLIMGVCNGFQIMTKIGLLPGLEEGQLEQQVALMQNDCGAFQDFWIELGFESDSPCVFTRGLERMPLPIRHGEGKLFTLDKKLIETLEERNCIPCRYIDPTSGEPTMAFPFNPNGSIHAIAGLCDPTGRIFGLMPHPEAYLFPQNHPQWDLQARDGLLPETGLGLELFRNAVRYLQG